MCILWDIISIQWPWKFRVLHTIKWHFNIKAQYICQSPKCSFVNRCWSLGWVRLLLFSISLKYELNVAFICAGITTVSHTSHGDSKHTPCYPAQESGWQEKWISKSSAKRKFRVFTRRCWKSRTKGSGCVKAVMQEYFSTVLLICVHVIC